MDCPLQLGLPGCLISQSETWIGIGSLLDVHGKQIYIPLWHALLLLFTPCYTMFTSVILFECFFVTHNFTTSLMKLIQTQFYYVTYET